MSDPLSREPEDINFELPEDDEQEVAEDMAEAQESELKAVFDFHGKQMQAIYESIK